MNTEAHLAAGWILGHLGGEETRRFRVIVTLAAVAPDADAVSYVFGRVAYGHVHHALGHNVFFGVLTGVLAAWLFRDRGWRGLAKLALFSQLAFYSHYFGDYFLTKFPLVFFWPVSDREFMSGYRFGLDHPINQTLSYLSLVLFVMMAVAWKRSPLEIVSPKLDRLVVNLFRAKPLVCHVCGGKANERCDACARPCCLKHGRITRRLDVRCGDCAKRDPAAQRRG